MAAVTVSRCGDRLIAIKQVPAEHARDIEREAETLQRLDHPGVVRFVDLVETPDHGRALHTEFVSSDTWATRPITDPTSRAAAVAAVAEVVADLHDMGFAHCHINPSHVLHGDGDRLVLCGFRLAAEATPENRRRDLVAIADLCHDPAIEQGPLAAKLSALADAARAGRLDVRELARRLAMVPDKRSTATEPGRTTPDGTGRRHRARPRKRLLVVTALLSASVAVAAAGIWSRVQQENVPVTITDRDAPLTASHANPTAASAAPMIPGIGAGIVGPGIAAEPRAPEGNATAASPAPMIPGIGAGILAPGIFGPGILGPGIAAEPRPLEGNAGSAMDSTAGGSLLSPTSSGTGHEPPGGSAGHEVGTVLEHGGRLYGVGAPGDFIETGDWDCDGEPTPAIVRPSTGDVVLFNAWPGPHQSIAMPVRWKVDVPTGAEAIAHGSCHLLRVYTPAGSRLFDPMEGR